MGTDRSQRWKRRIALLGAITVVFGILLCVWMKWREQQRYLRKCRDLVLIVSPDYLSVDDGSRTVPETEGHKTISGEVYVWGEPPGHFVVVKGLKSIKLEFSDGVIIESPWRIQSHGQWRCSYSGRGFFDGLQHVLGATMLILREREAIEPHIELMRVKENDYISHKAKKGKYSAEAICSVYEYNVVGALPLKKGASYERGSDQIAIIDVLEAEKGCTITIREHFDMETEKRQSSQELTEDKVKRFYVLRNEKRGQAFMSGASRGKGDVANSRKFLYSECLDIRMFIHDLNKEWFADADLLWIEAVPIREIAWPLRIENFSFAEALPPESTERGTIKRPSDEQIRRENARRERIGLRTVKPSWHFEVDSSPVEQRWKFTKDGRFAKTVHRDRGKIKWEWDHYSTDNLVTRGPGLFRESLSLQYDYAQKSVKLRVCTTDVEIQALLEPYLDGTLNVAEAMGVADQILAKWGMSRL